MNKKYTVKCTRCRSLFRTTKFEKERYCPQCGEITTFLLKKETRTLFHPHVTPFYVRCRSCLNIGLIDNGRIPDACPVCGDNWKKYKPVEDKSLLDTILQAIGGNDDPDRLHHGYYRCDMRGWTIDPDDLRPPSELEAENSIFVGEEYRRQPELFEYAPMSMVKRRG